MRSHGKVTPQWKSTLNHFVSWWDEKLTVPHFCGNNSANTLDLWKCLVKSPFYFVSRSVRKKADFCDATNGFHSAKWRLSGERKNAILMMTCYNPVLQAHLKFTCVNEIRGIVWKATRKHKRWVRFNFYVYAWAFMHCLYFIYARKMP